jgi:hypothetical protein
MIKAKWALLFFTSIFSSLLANEVEFSEEKKVILNELEFIVPETLIARCDQSLCTIEKAQVKKGSSSPISIFLINGGANPYQSLREFFGTAPAIIEGLAGPVEAIDRYKVSLSNNGLILFLSKAKVYGDDGESLIDIPIAIIYSESDTPYLYVQVVRRDSKKYRKKIQSFLTSINPAE